MSKPTGTRILKDTWKFETSAGNRKEQSRTGLGSMFRSAKRCQKSTSEKISPWPPRPPQSKISKAKWTITSKGNLKFETSSGNRKKQSKRRRNEPGQKATFDFFSFLAFFGGFWPYIGNSGVLKTLGKKFCSSKLA